MKFLEDTWPPEKVIHFDNWTIRISDGAGKRASAISLEGTWEETSFRKLKDLLRKLGKSEVTVQHPALRKILNDTIWD